MLVVAALADPCAGWISGPSQLSVRVGLGHAATVSTKMEEGDVRATRPDVVSRRGAIAGGVGISLLPLLPRHSMRPGRCGMLPGHPLAATFRRVQTSLMSGSGRESDAILFMPGKASPKERTQSQRWQQWYSSSEKTTEDSQTENPQEVEEEDQLSGLERLLLSTERSLDWPVVKLALANCSLTSMGRRALETMSPLLEVSEVERAYNALEEVRLLADQGVSLPVSKVHDIVALAGLAGKGDVLDLEELKDCAGTLAAMYEISQLLAGRNDTVTLTDISQDIDLNAEVVRLFERSFDASGQLSIRQYPQLDQLRKEIIQIEASVSKTMDALVKDAAFASKLQDKFYTIRENRFVLPVAQKLRCQYNRSCFTGTKVQILTAMRLPGGHLEQERSAGHRARTLQHRFDCVHRAAAGHRSQQPPASRAGRAQGRGATHPQVLTLLTFLALLVQKCKF